MVLEIALQILIIAMAGVRVERPHEDQDRDVYEPVLYGPLMVYGRCDSAERD